LTTHHNHSFNFSHSFFKFLSTIWLIHNLLQCQNLINISSEYYAIAEAHHSVLSFMQNQEIHKNIQIFDVKLAKLEHEQREDDGN
jgi:hypothetical protein